MVLSIDPGELATHGAHVTAVADTADQAASAAAGMNLGGGAFGIMCAFMVPPLQLLSAPATGMLQAVAANVRAAGDTITAAAHMFEENDQELAAVSDRIRQELAAR